MPVVWKNLVKENNKMKINNYNTETIKIDKGIEKPRKSGGRDGKWFNVFVKLNIGDSFAIPYKDKEEATKIQTAIQASKQNYIKKHDSNFNGSIRVLFLKKEVRFWRDK